MYNRNVSVSDEEGERNIDLISVDAATKSFMQKLRDAEALHYAIGLDSLAGIRCVQLYSEALAGLSTLSRVMHTSHPSRLE
ncbi:hypothetical protein LSM04_007334 [Trypanosoma melophagium]|uniref:uncharacterized protein n=1 Tax=Trypanosoma melophagium TaxID=715481 RepID=UPI00351A5EFF|nr:hypothetical protein LSM04_004377 [Trypanosoma melophagium]KAH9593500.1 hypothetical protein LSM04_007334 [Trypanosoma melophagium]